jgi:threonine dehydratase
MLKSSNQLFNSVNDAYKRISPYTKVTPVLNFPSVSQLAGKEFAFKCEYLQQTGSFKFRGACNALFSLDDDAANLGVVTHSSG